MAIEVSRDDLADYLGEGIHTAFRKACDCREGVQIHRLIDEMPPDKWANVIDFVVDALIPFLDKRQS